MIHACLIFVFFVPLVYTFLINRSQQVQQEIFLKGFWVLCPLILTALAVRKCKSFLSYVFWNLVIVGITMGGAFLLTLRMDNRNLSFGFMFAIIIQTVIILWDRFMGRLNKMEKEETKQQENPNWQPRYNLLEKPSFYVLGYFLVLYIIGLSTASRILCNQVLFATILYTVITLIYQFIEKTQQYFLVNERVCNLPGKRIYGIKGIILFGFFGVLLFFVVLSVATTPLRQYQDIRKWTVSHPVKEVDIKPNQTIEQPMKIDPIQEMKQQMGPVKKAPKWLEYLLNGVGVFAFLLVFVSILKAMKQSAKDFRKSYDDNGDLIETLEGESFVKKTSFKQKNKQKLSKRERIRKEYKEYIRAYKKELPKQSDAPYEIEANAGIEKEIKTQEIHKLYEQARYDKEE